MQSVKFTDSNSGRLQAITVREESPEERFEQTVVVDMEQVARDPIQLAELLHGMSRWLNELSEIVHNDKVKADQERPFVKGMVF